MTVDGAHDPRCEQTRSLEVDTSSIAAWPENMPRGGICLRRLPVAHSEGQKGRRSGVSHGLTLRREESRGEFAQRGAHGERRERIDSRGMPRQRAIVVRDERAAGGGQRVLDVPAIGNRLDHVLERQPRSGSAVCRRARVHDEQVELHPVHRHRRADGRHLAPRGEVRREGTKYLPGGESQHMCGRRLRARGAPRPAPSAAPRPRRRRPSRPRAGRRSAPPPPRRRSSARGTCVTTSARTMQRCDAQRRGGGRSRVWPCRGVHDRRAQLIVRVAGDGALPHAQLPLVAADVREARVLVLVDRRRPRVGHVHARRVHLQRKVSISWSAGWTRGVRRLRV